MLTWSAYRLDESRADGALFSFLVVAFAGFTWWRQSRITLLPGSFPVLAAILCGLLPLFFLAGQSTGWAPTLGGFADRAPLLAAWVFTAAIATWGSLSMARLAPALLAGGAVAAILGIVQACGWNPPGYDSFLSIRPAYPFAGPSHAIEVQLPLLLLGLAFLPAAGRARRLYWLAIIPIAFQVGYLGSNAGRVAFLVAAVFLFLRQQSHRVPLLAAILLVLCGELSRGLLGATSTENSNLEIPGQDIATVNEIELDSVPRGFSVRKEIYLATAGQLFTTPLGIGIGRFEIDYPEWRSAEEARLSSGNWRDTSHRIPKTPHQEYLLAAIELGWIGSLLLGFALWRLFRLRQNNLPNGQTFHATDPVWISFAVLALFRSPFSDNPAALGLAAILLGTDFLGYRGRNLSFASALPMSLGLLAAVPAWSQIRGEHFAAKAVRDPANLGQHFADAVDSRPWDNRSLVMLGSYYITLEEWNAARNCFDQALVHSPTDLAALTAYINVERFAPDGDEILMLRLLARAEEFAPFHPSIINARVQWIDSYRLAFQQEAVRRTQLRIPFAGKYWTAASLAESHILSVQGRLDDARKALYRAASLDQDGNRGLIERTAEREDLAPDTIAQLTRKVYPRWPEVIY